MGTPLRMVAPLEGGRRCSRLCSLSPAAAPRGAVFGGDPRITFQVSADAVNATATPIEFGNVNATYPTAFATFSSPRLFTSLTNNVLEVEFFVPGTLNRATVSGFGAVFTD